MSQDHTSLGPVAISSGRFFAGWVRWRRRSWDSPAMRGATQVWSLSNLHGDTPVVTDASGAVQGPQRTYDPFGNATGRTLVENSAGAFDYGWLGTHQRGTEHEAGLASTVEMGARQYDSTLGRFLEVDSIEGGCQNDYVYVSDPVNQLDLDGTQGCGKNGGASWHHRNSDAYLRSLGHGKWEFRYGFSQSQLRYLYKKGATGILTTTFVFAVTDRKGKVIDRGEIGHKTNVPLDYQPHGTFKLTTRNGRPRVPPGSTLSIYVSGSLQFRGPSFYSTVYKCTF